MKVWVVMGNDYPSAVFSTEKRADGYVAARKEDEPRVGPRIYWRSYEFHVDKEEVT